MKKKKICVLLLASVLLLGGCARAQTPAQPTNEGLTPHSFSREESHLLQAFGMENTAQMIFFRAPKEAITLRVDLYERDETGAWVVRDGGAISIGEEREPARQLAGEFAMQLAPDYTVACNLLVGGRSSFVLGTARPDLPVTISTHGFLTEFTKIELEQPIAVAYMIYDDGNAMKTYTLQDFADPSVFEGMDLVQFVTLTFSDQAL